MNKHVESFKSMIHCHETHEITLFACEIPIRQWFGDGQHGVVHRPLANNLFSLFLFFPDLCCRGSNEERLDWRR